MIAMIASLVMTSGCKHGPEVAGGAPPGPLEVSGEAHAPPCTDSLDSCPERGCAKEGSDPAHFNELKRRTTDANGQSITFDTATPITVQLLGDLQQAAGDVLARREFSADARARIASLPVGGVTLGEGVPVRLAGFMVSSPRPSGGVHPNSGESVNCNLSGQANNDFHIPFVDTAGQQDCEGVVVEMVPQNRPGSWTVSALKQIADRQQQVLVVGPLFYDNAHGVNGDCANPSGGDPKRMSLWEIHPVIEFYVCGRTDAPCSADSADGWNRLP